jgi:hypothetical protein
MNSVCLKVLAVQLIQRQSGLNSYLTPFSRSALF